MSLCSNYFRRLKDYVFSEEIASCEKGIVKYDFQVKRILDWIKAKKFLKRKALFYDIKPVATIERIRWLQTMFTTIGLRFIYNEIQDLELYYHIKPKKSPKFYKRLSRLLPTQSALECQKFMHLMFSNGAWVRLVAIDFQKDHQFVKIYFETSNPSLIDNVRDYFDGSVNFKPLCQILEYANFSNILFAGIAIVMDIKSENIRYNLYFTQNI